MRALSLLCFVAIVIGGRLAIVFYAGSPIPFHDQWYAEAQGILLPSIHHGLTIGHFFAPHGDHVIAPTKLLVLLLAKAEGKWDCVSQMVVNCVISALCLWPLIRWSVKRDPRGWVSALLCLLVGVAYGSPLFYGNIVWGFQSQILLMISFSVGHLYLVIVQPGGRLRWCLGMVSGLLAALCFASGYFAVVVGMAAMVVGRRSSGGSWRDVGGTLAGGAAIVALALWLAPAHSAMGTIDYGNILHTFVHALSFPARLYSGWALLFWIPTVVAVGLMGGRRELLNQWAFPVAAAIWCVLQVAAISIGRSEPVLALAPRYYDILMVGVVANGCLLIELVRYSWAHRAFRPAAGLLLTAWLLAIGAKTAEFVRTQTLGDMPTLVAQASSQIELVSRYYREQQNREVLRQAPFPTRTLPDAEFLGNMLDRPEIKAMWPDAITRWQSTDELRQMPWLGLVTREVWFRVSLLVAIAAVVVLYVVILWLALEALRKLTGLAAVDALASRTPVR